MEKILFTSKAIEVECFQEDLTRECVIYKFTFPNGKQYIGQTWCTLESRIKRHINNAYNKNRSDYDFKKSRAIRKYKKFKVDVLYQGFQLNEQEKYFINYFDTIEKGYNICEGGNGILGFHHSDETKKKISEKRLGTHHSDAAKRKMSEIKLGTHHSEETKRKIAEKILGANNHNSKAIFMCDKNTQEIIKRFEAISDAVRYLFGENLNPKETNKKVANITYYLKHPVRTKFGYKWKFVDEDPN